MTCFLFVGMVSVCDSPRTTSAQSNIVELLTEPFLPFTFFTYLDNRYNSCLLVFTVSLITQFWFFIYTTLMVHLPRITFINQIWKQNAQLTSKTPRGLQNIQTEQPVPRHASDWETQHQEADQPRTDAPTCPTTQLHTHGHIRRRIPSTVSASRTQEANSSVVLV